PTAVRCTSLRLLIIHLVWWLEKQTMAPTFLNSTALYLFQTPPPHPSPYPPLHHPLPQRPSRRQPRRTGIAAPRLRPLGNAGGTQGTSLTRLLPIDNVP